MSKENIITLFRDAPLYKKIAVIEPKENQEPDFDISLYFYNVAFKFFCPKESDEHTFRLSEEDVRKLPHYLNLSRAASNVVDNEHRWNFTTHISAPCQSCGFSMQFLIYFFSEIPLERRDKKLPKLIAMKIGQYPPIERLPEKEVLAYLTDEDKDNYKKALTTLSFGFGIGAYAYFRRIVENEIKRFVQDISQLEFENADKVKNALQQYEHNHQMTNLIDTITPYVPASLLVGGQNPIKLLYQQLSEGIHQYSESECMARAQSLDIILRFTIKKVNSEKYEIKKVKEALKRLN